MAQEVSCFGLRTALFQLMLQNSSYANRITPSVRVAQALYTATRNVCFLVDFVLKPSRGALASGTLSCMWAHEPLPGPRGEVIRKRRFSTCGRYPCVYSEKRLIVFLCGASVYLEFHEVASQFTLFCPSLGVPCVWAVKLRTPGDCICNHLRYFDSILALKNFRIRTWTV